MGEREQEISINTFCKYELLKKLAVAALKIRPTIKAPINRKN
jgi:hypothetical protein